MRAFSEVVRLPEFERDVRKLLKKYGTLEEDLAIAIRSALYAHHKLKQNYDGIVSASYLNIGTHSYYKLRKMACMSIRGKGKRSGLRLIYAYYEDTGAIELIEIYHKSSKENENKERILNHHKQKNC